MADFKVNGDPMQDALSLHGLLEGVDFRKLNAVVFFTEDPQDWSILAQGTQLGWLGNQTGTV